MKSILEVLDITYTYPGTSVQALRRLTLRIPEGKKTAICGHNGSGKSTFFLHAVGIHRPQTGAVMWKGSHYSYQRKDLQKLREHVGLVFQDPEHQLILGTPYEDVSYGLRNAKVPEPEIKQRTEQILSQMGLHELAHTPIHHLSLGQKKRVALAGVLVLRPDLLLLDEPTAFLDRRSEQQLITELDRIHHSGITTVMATHDMNLAYAWADWMLVMDGGQCVMEGKPEEVFKATEDILALGLELPMLYELWQAMPVSVQEQYAPPRTALQFREVLQQTMIHHPMHV